MKGIIKVHLNSLAVERSFEGRSCFLDIESFLRFFDEYISFELVLSNSRVLGCLFFIAEPLGSGALEDRGSIRLVGGKLFSGGILHNLVGSRSWVLYLWLQTGSLGFHEDGVAVHDLVFVQVRSGRSGDCRSRDLVEGLVGAGPGHEFLPVKLTGALETRALRDEAVAEAFFGPGVRLFAHLVEVLLAEVLARSWHGRFFR